MRRSLLLISSILVLLVVRPAVGQLYQGPANGSIPSGVTVSTEGFAPADAGPGPIVKHRMNKQRVYPLKDPANLPVPSGPEGSNYFEDPSAGESVSSVPPITIASFNGISQTNAIPPDPHVAVGPNHIIQVVNSSFRISDKAGNTLRTISADSWYSSTVSGVFSFDPKVFYDHFADRWVMVWLDQNDSPQRSNYLVSVSDDSDPLGTWYNWALNAAVNGSTSSGNWADYQGVGFDSQAFYFTSNQWTFPGSYQYVKIRIMAKSQFYANTAGAIAWTDFWDIRDEIATGMIGIRPSTVYTAPNEYYLIGNSPFTTSTYMVIYRIANPLTSPALTVTNIPVTSSQLPPNAGQLGSGTAIDGGGYNAGLRAEPVYRDSSLWVAHSVRSGSGNQYSSVRYLRFNTTNNSVSEDVAFGANGFWHIYPNLAVDKDNNIAITYTRSGTTEYAGAAFTWRLDSDPPGLRPTEVVRPGVAPYVQVANGRNRWGDYLGIAVDPSDQNNFWMLSEYVPSANQWGTWVHGMRLTPYAGTRAGLSRTGVDFGSIEVDVPADTTAVTLYNYGTDDLQISGISNSNSAFTLPGLPSFPQILSTYDSIQIRVVFNPAVHGVVDDTIRIAGVDPAHSTISLRGKGVLIGTAMPGVMYAASGTPAAQLYTINLNTGAATLTGSLGINDLQGMTIRPATKELYGVRPGGGGTLLYRISSQYGDALQTGFIPLINLRAMAFTASDTLYGATSTGMLYRINVVTGDTVFVGRAQGINYASLSFSPTSGQLWGSVRPPISNRDKIYLVNTSDGDTTLVGGTGDGGATPSIAFDPLGRLYGLKGISSQQNSLILIDTLTAAGTTIGAAGLSGLQAIAMRTDSLVTSVDENPTADIPASFSLKQNYPNPFNPSTNIEFGIAKSEFVSLKVYNMLGQEIAVLVNEQRQAGSHTATFDAHKLPSGVYYYRLQSGSFSETRKMVLMK